MLLRFIIKNLFSFKEQTEFNLLPGKATRLKHHKYKRDGVELLKLTALYGANGSGKSNLVKAIALLKDIIVSGRIPNALNHQKFKLSGQSQHEPTELGIEFFCNTSFYYYSISIDNNVILDEYFGQSGPDQKEDQMIFHRKQDGEKISVEFFKGFEEKNENVVLGKVITQDLLKPQQPLFFLLSSLTSNDAFIDIRSAYKWFKSSLQVIYPDTIPHHLAQELDSNPAFKQFANELMCSFHTGIAGLKVESKPIEEFFGKDNQQQVDSIVSTLRDDPKTIYGVITGGTNGEEVSVVNDNGAIKVKRLLFEHEDDKNKRIAFNFGEESDGTRRLLEYIPVFNLLLHDNCTIIVDEIERSIHPLIIRELIAKFSVDESTKGQLIFSTHESNLLDQDIFRTDEIWFAEKEKPGFTKLYSLSDYKEHNTIDIRKGYLNGRYGGIPFLGNLQDLNWDK